MTQTKAGMNLGSWLTVLFVGLKLTGYIDWSWWWVLSPIWIPLTLAFAIMLLVAWMEESKKTRKAKR